MHFDWQLAAAAIIVAAAAWHVGRVIAGQLAGFRRAAKPGAIGCGGCSEGAKKNAAPQLITLSAAPPRRVVVPKADESQKTDP